MFANHCTMIGVQCYLPSLVCTSYKFKVHSENQTQYIEELFYKISLLTILLQQVSGKSNIVWIKYQFGIKSIAEFIFSSKYL